MPTAEYNKGFRDAVKLMQQAYSGDLGSALEVERTFSVNQETRALRKRKKLSPWNKFVKANSKKPRFIYKSGSNKGKLNLKKMGVAFRKTPAGKRKK
tara:strand:- start:111 stop:401 length:291 start_codon:yes stop_codon:yes gene_type:complete